MVSRNVAIALGIICVIVIAGLGGAIAYYASTHSHTDSDYDSLRTQNANLQNEVNDFNTTLNFGKSIFWVNDQTISQNASSYTSWTFSAKYAGIVSVEIFPTSTLNTYAQVIYSAYEHYVYQINYNQLIPVGAGLATFPIVPSNIEVRVGNTNTLEAANETVTITYYY